MRVCFVFVEFGSVQASIVYLYTDFEDSDLHWTALYDGTVVDRIPISFVICIIMEDILVQDI